MLTFISKTMNCDKVYVTNKYTPKHFINTKMINDDDNDCS